MYEGGEDGDIYPRVCVTVRVSIKSTLSLNIWVDVFHFDKFTVKQQ